MAEDKTWILEEKPFTRSVVCARLGGIAVRTQILSQMTGDWFDHSVVWLSLDAFTELLDSSTSILDTLDPTIDPPSICPMPDFKTADAVFGALRD